MATIQYDVNLSSPNNMGAPGWYDGSGNPNGGFAVDTENGVEVGLRVKLRQDPNVIDSVTGVYDVPIGPQLTSPSHAAWNYEFSIDLRPGGVGTLTLADITATLTITDVTTGATATVDALSYFGDNSGYGSGGKDTPATGTDWGSQNSENPIFASFPLAADYDENAVRLYEFDLVVKQGTNVLASDTIYAQTVAPEPGSALLFAGGLALIMVIVRRRGIEKALPGRTAFLKLSD
jgi:hypothetical protein